MSTFDGFVYEFPDIRIDFFRVLKRPPALAYLLSHVHSDHLAGLETFKGPFIYCSAATKEILLRLKKYPCRLNYAKGIFENPRMQTYKHLKNVLKPIPLETPTILDLPGSRIQVTLVDANHCVGAVMFLIESDGKAVLYTGDIRSEPWFVNAIARNPSMVEYSSGLKTLDRIYLDTSMLDDYHLQTKAEGLRELLEKVVQYPQDTIFCMQAWTYGYEEVWIALSKALKSKIHVDEYKSDVYRSLVTKSEDHNYAAQTHLSKEAPYLVGFTCGNNHHEGCLTLDEEVRIHSCEKGMGCSIMENSPVVWIQPVVAHLKDGQDMVEVGIGGGGDDLAQKTSVAAEDIISLVEMMAKNTDPPHELRDDIQGALKKVRSGLRDVSLDIDISDLAEEPSIMDILKSVAKKVKALSDPVEEPVRNQEPKSLPNRIRFPYARHSSLPELRHLVQAFKPKDVWPCTVDPARWVARGITMRNHFGDCCTGDVFEHDLLMEEQRQQPAEPADTQGTSTSRQGDSSPVNASAEPPEPASSPVTTPRRVSQQPGAQLQLQRDHNFPAKSVSNPFPQQGKRDYDEFVDDEVAADDSEGELDLQGDSQASAISDRTYERRFRAFEAAQANIAGDGWGAIGLISTSDHHSSVDKDLGGL